MSKKGEPRAQSDIEQALRVEIKNKKLQIRAMGRMIDHYRNLHPVRGTITMPRRDLAKLRLVVAPDTGQHVTFEERNEALRILNSLRIETNEEMERRIG
jgi:hypothetical protein